MSEPVRTGLDHCMRVYSAVPENSPRRFFRHELASHKRHSPPVPSHLVRQHRPSLIAERLGGPCASSLAATVQACTRPPPGAQTNTDERDPTTTRTTNRCDTSEGEDKGHDP